MDFEVNKSPNDPSKDLNWIAMHYAIIGEKELAIEWLEQFVELSPAPVPLKDNLMFKNLREDPRFQALIKKTEYQE